MASNHPGIIPYMQAIPVVGWAIATLVLPLTETNSGALDAQVRIVICQIWVRMREWEWFTHCHDDCIYIYIFKKIVLPIWKPEPPQLINSSAARCHSQEAPLQNFRTPHPFFKTKIWPNIPNLRAGGLFTCCYHRSCSASEIKAWGLEDVQNSHFKNIRKSDTGDAWDTDTVSNGRNQRCIEVGLFLPKPLGYCWWSMPTSTCGPLSRQSQFISGTPERNEKT